MVLGFSAREATKDVDVVVRAPAAAIVQLLAAELSDELGTAGRPTGSTTPRRDSALTMPRTRARVEAESPEPLRKRNVFAPAEYATFV